MMTLDPDVPLPVGAGVSAIGASRRGRGLPGESVQIVNGHVMINGAALASLPGIPPYTTSRSGGTPIRRSGCDKPIILGRGEYFCLGDNSPIAVDSRYWPSIGEHQPGAMPAASIVGTATYIYWPPSRWRKLF
jgi:signal peptidase I